MPFFSKHSLQKLETCDARLQEICHEAIKIYDFTVLCGKRDEEEQNNLLIQGKTKLEFPNSKHNKFPSQAVDIAPCPIDWSDFGRFRLLAGIIFGIAHSKNVKIRWGGDWNMNWNSGDENFLDLVHFELL
ncbi:MAG: M15 family metallopeptidase [Rickettsiales bacterium]|nr:M15 family metallopeptidase [Pseudomonadota bacterium]MDA0966632.1 M15 family metallopeptidase [Pseudomonadota bacterium]MDG4543660.1 M15 family metallopeptidase [Rickettsiales bacterium]MDG4545807.1 M15 family metallopeptidase [Rickettsiales bacterium]MDG4547419.1 M15 family metallopeptidase [Rickettsiales bacterium]